jgi:hypothetical protein
LCYVLQACENRVENALRQFAGRWRRLCSA